MLFHYSYYSVLFTILFVFLQLNLLRVKVTEESINLIEDDSPKIEEVQKFLVGNKENEKEIEFNKIENGEKLSRHEDFFSACLLIKDENHNLPEWIAYHFHVAGLRDLVMCVDPSSITSPVEILNRWKGMMIIELLTNDSYFTKKEYAGKPPPNLSLDDMYTRHRYRQKHCYFTCIKNLQKRNRTWTFFADADEYLTFNSLNKDDDKFFFNNNEFILKNSTLNSEVKLGRREKLNLTKDNMELLNKRTSLPLVGEKSISEFIAEEKNKVPWNRPCIVIPRLQFGNAEEPNQTNYSKKFNTLRFFSHAKKGSFQENRFGKSILDISRIKVSRLGQIRNVHSMVKVCGGVGSGAPPYQTALLRMNHYTLSQEAFFAKQDFRDSKRPEWYKARSINNAFKSYEMKNWLPSFVQNVGNKTAEILLQGAGVIDSKQTFPDRIGNTKKL